MKEPIAKKVERIVKKFGFTDICVLSDQSGVVELSGTVPDINDRPLVVAIARTTPGVREVRSDITIEKTPRQMDSSSNGVI